MATSWSKRLATQNPFYLISVVLVLYGLNSLFAPDPGSQNNPLFMIGSLVAYICLMAGAGIVIVRKARAWSDARMLLILLFFVLMTSTCFIEDVLWIDSTIGRITAFALVVFGAGIIEILNRTLVLGLSILERMLLQLWLALFAAAPVHIVELAKVGTGEAYHRMGHWLLAFPVIASTLFTLGLWTGRPGKRYGRTPWSWPACPFSVFFMLLVGATYRAQWLTMSNYAVGSDASAFGPWMTVPMILSLALVGFVICLRYGSQRIAHVFELMPLAALMVIADLPSGRSNEAHLFEIVRSAVADPRAAVMFACSLFWAFGMLKRRPVSGWMFTFMGLALTDRLGMHGDAWAIGTLSIWLVALLSQLFRRPGFGPAVQAVLIGSALSLLVLDEFMVRRAAFYWAAHAFAGAIFISSIIFKNQVSRVVRVVMVVGLLLHFAAELVSPTTRALGSGWGYEVYVAALPAALVGLYLAQQMTETLALAIGSSLMLGIRYLVCVVRWFADLNVPDGLFATLFGLAALGAGVWYSLHRARSTRPSWPDSA